MRNLCHSIQQKILPALFVIIIINIVLFTLISVPNLYKTSFIEKTRFNIPFSWQKYHSKKPINFKLPTISNLKPFLVSHEKLKPELYKYALYSGCRMNDESFTVYILTTADNYERRDKFRTKWAQNRPEEVETESLIFVMILDENSSSDDEIPEELFMEHRMHDDLLVIWKEAEIVEKPEISAIISHAAECEENMDDDYSRHILITTDDYFWFADSLSSFLLADINNLPNELGLMMGDLNFGNEDSYYETQMLPPKCGDGACVLSKTTVQKLHEISEEQFGNNKQVLYFNDHMTYLSLLVWKVNERFQSGEDTQLKIQYHSDKRFWNGHESDVDNLTCLKFNFPIKIYKRYQEMCEM